MKSTLITLLLAGSLIFGFSTIAQGAVVVPTLAVTYEYAGDTEALKGFTLFKDGIEVCSTTDPRDRSFTCTTELENKDTSFTLVANNKYGSEMDSNPSAAIVYNPPDSMFNNLAVPSNLNVTHIIIEITINNDTH